jgi:hypothetical protein
MALRTTTREMKVTAVTCAALALPGVAAAQVDPLLFLKRTKPNVVLVVETTERMQRDARSPDDYLDPYVYTRSGTAHETPLGVSAVNTSAHYRRKFRSLVHDDNAITRRLNADDIEVVGDLTVEFGEFEWMSRLGVARRALSAVVAANKDVVRFGIVKTRQTSAQIVDLDDVNVRAVSQKMPTDTGEDFEWHLRVGRVSAFTSNGSTSTPSAVAVVQPESGNAAVLAKLALHPREVGALIPAGADDADTTDAPIDTMLIDAKAEAVRLAAADSECRNTVVVLIVGGARGNTSSGNVETEASEFLNIGANHRVPVYVIAVAPDAFGETQLQNIARNSGGLFTKITSAMVSATPPGQPVPGLVKAMNLAVQHAFASTADFDTDPTAALPIGPSTEFQVTSPIIGTVNLEGASDITGAALINSTIEDPDTHVKIPQQSNLLVTAGFSLPGFGGTLRGFRVYRPEADESHPSHFKFVGDGTRLWVARTPASAATRNIYTALPDGSMVAFTAANAAALSPYLKTADAVGLIEVVRNQPLGAIIGSTPAVMDVPSLDPPPDTEYPAFSEANRNRRSIIWVGANDGMVHAIDARLGVEVWAFIPFNLLPKLHTLQNGQAVGDFHFFADGSPKVSDVKIDGQWRTYLVVGQGAGGTFYQAFDVTLPNMENTVPATSDSESAVLSYFATPTSVPLSWAFPKYSSFDATRAPYGDLAPTADPVEKTVGETWSDPAIGQIETGSGPYAVLTGSGFLKYSVQQQANRGGTVAGTTFYILKIETGEVLASRSVGSDNLAETVDNCVTAGDCTFLKNALQADALATGPADMPFITTAYIGDLDGRIWRFDIELNAALAPAITGPTKLFDSQGQPNVSSLVTVNVGGTKRYLFQATGSDILPTTGVNQIYRLAVVLDNGAVGENVASIPLEPTDNENDDEKVTSFPAVAGDIVFFTTTTFRPQAPCAAPDANLYAFTFAGGPAYDTNNDGTITRGAAGDSTRVRTTTAARATAPFIADQHLVFAAGNNLELFGDPEDFNNGVGQAGIRILSWRDVP